MLPKLLSKQEELQGSGFPLHDYVAFCATANTNVF